MVSKSQTSGNSRWTVLIIVAVVMMMGYIFWDMMSPLSTTLKAPAAQGGQGWSSAEYGFYAGSYSIFNIFFLMLFFGGIILDKFGIRLTGLLATGCMLVGAVINWYAIAYISPEQEQHLAFTLFGLIPSHIKTQVLVSAFGFGLFGMGCDITGITVSKVITKWFTGHTLATAMGFQVALARLGTATALSFSPLIALHLGGVTSSLLCGIAILGLAFILFMVYCIMDKVYDTAHATPAGSPPQNGPSTERKEEFHAKGLSVILRNPYFWSITLLCVFYYASIRPFMKFATDMMVNTFGVEQIAAGWIVAAIPYGAIFLSPLFGMLYDRSGHGVRLMFAGCAMLTASMLLLAFPMVHNSLYALSLMVVIGVAFSLVPAALWPSVPKLVPLKNLGTAYSIIYFIQNIGLMLVPIIIGQINDAHTVTVGVGAVHAASAAGTPFIDYRPAMLFFAAEGAISCLMALFMRRAEH